MELRSSTLNAYFQNLDTVFNKAFSSATPEWDKVAMQINSNTESNVYGWMEQLPGVREWIGPRQFLNLKSNGYSLTNQDWEESVMIKRTALEDDSYGIYTPLTQQLAYNLAYHPDVKTYALLQNGFVNTCWDGKAFFAADHVLRQGKTGENILFTNTTNLALTGPNFNTVLSAMKRNIGGGENPFMGNPTFTLVVPPELQSTAEEIVLMAKNSFGADNTNYKKAELVVSAQITTTTYWFILVTNNPIKPLIYQLRESPRVHVPKATDESVIETNYYKFMADYRGAWGYGLPVLGYGSTGDA
jgi:phage major head subunit gpT-like protein